MTSSVITVNEMTSISKISCAFSGNKDEGRIICLRLCHAGATIYRESAGPLWQCVHNWWRRPAGPTNLQVGCRSFWQCNHYLVTKGSRVICHSFLVADFWSLRTHSDSQRRNLCAKCARIKWFTRDDREEPIHILFHKLMDTTCKNAQKCYTRGEWMMQNPPCRRPAFQAARPRP